MDIPSSVLAQLGLKVQHALRAFTAADRKNIKQTAENYPETEFYKTEDEITQLGIGEAFITMLNEKGVPTPLVHTMLAPPVSRMDILTDTEIDSIVNKSKLVSKYNQTIDNQAAEKTGEQKQVNEERKSSKKEETIFDNPMMRQMGRTAASVITRSLLGALGLGGRTRRRSLF
jgi:hypothetical protein